MAVKLAITISGAVSLGTFEAGALYEVLKALEHHNTKLPAQSASRIEIDVITGASAGGMSAAIAAQKLLYDRDSLSRPYDNALYKAWVERADLSKLLQLGGDDPDLSILSSNCIRRIADEFIPFSIDPAAISPHPSCARELKIGLALSNLNGIDYSISIYGGGVNESLATGQEKNEAEKLDWHEQCCTGKFVYTRYQDELLDSFARDSFDPRKWINIREAAIASGAFPFVFRAIELSRQKSYYLARGAASLPSTEDKYAFTDGGVFQNEPLGLAKNLVDQISSPQTNADDRYYIFIAPCARTSSMDREPLKASDMNALNMGTALAKAVFNEARFQDWVLAERINQDVMLLDARAQALLDLLIPHKNTGSSAALSADEIMAVTSPVLNVLYRVRKRERKWSSDPGETLQSARMRLRMQYAHELARFGKDEQLANAWLDLVLLLEFSAHLGRKDQMKILGITAQESELAGAKYFQFQGFFDSKLRRHDYEVGRLKSRQILRSLGNLINHGLQDTDDDLQITAGLAGFDVLAAGNISYRVLLDRLFFRSFDYACRPLLHSCSIKRLLARWIRWTILFPLSFVRKSFGFALGGTVK